jgi:wyosine [tRNA(Phe)-imidazoG37] synthetase (radical SAM superfamily)
MATFLFDEIVFGPVNSRRLGVSLGINLLPNDSKLCNFNCIYCECGWTKNEAGTKKRFHPRIDVATKLEEKLQKMKADGQLPDVITYAGNGEPTMHPEFDGIIDDTIRLREEYCREAKIAVLTNATMLHKDSVMNALLRIDQNILKLDSAYEETISQINIPLGNIDKKRIMEGIKKFDGNFILQTLFVKGSYEGKTVDNSTEKEVNAWLEDVKELRPKEVMIYTIARDTPVPDLEKVSKERLDEIAGMVNQLGIKTQISY